MVPTPAQNDNKVQSNSGGGNLNQPLHTTTVNVHTSSNEISRNPTLMRNKIVERREQSKTGGLSSGEIGLLDKLRMRRNDKQQKVHFIPFFMDSY